MLSIKSLDRENRLLFYFFHSGNVHGLREEDTVHRERMLVLLREQTVRPTSPASGPSVEEAYCFGSLLTHLLSLYTIGLSGEASEGKTRMRMNLKKLLEGSPSKT